MDVVSRLVDQNALTRSALRRRPSIMPLIPSPGIPKIVSTPQSARRESQDFRRCVRHGGARTHSTPIQSPTPRGCRPLTGTSQLPYRLQCRVGLCSGCRALAHAWGCRSDSCCSGLLGKDRRARSMPACSTWYAPTRRVTRSAGASESTRAVPAVWATFFQTYPAGNDRGPCVALTREPGNPVVQCRDNGAGGQRFRRSVPVTRELPDRPSANHDEMPQQEDREDQGDGKHDGGQEPCVLQRRRCPRRRQRRRTSAEAIVGSNRDGRQRCRWDRLAAVYARRGDRRGQRGNTEQATNDDNGYPTTRPLGVVTHVDPPFVGPSLRPP